MVKVAELLTQIRVDVDAARFRAIDLAREAGLPPTTVYSMLDEGWSNKAIANVEALAEAYQRITSRIDSPTPPEGATADT